MRYNYFASILILIQTIRPHTHTYTHTLPFYVLRLHGIRTRSIFGVPSRRRLLVSSSLFRLTWQRNGVDDSVRFDETQTLSHQICDCRVCAVPPGRVVQIVERRLLATFRITFAILYHLSVFAKKKAAQENPSKIGAVVYTVCVAHNVKRHTYNTFHGGWKAKQKGPSFTRHTQTHTQTHISVKYQSLKLLFLAYFQPYTLNEEIERHTHSHYAHIKTICWMAAVVCVCVCVCTYFIHTAQMLSKWFTNLIIVVTFTFLSAATFSACQQAQWNQIIMRVWCSFSFVAEQMCSLKLRVIFGIKVISAGALAASIPL